MKSPEGKRAPRSAGAVPGIYQVRSATAWTGIRKVKGPAVDSKAFYF